MSDFFVESLDHPFLIRLTMANSGESFLVDQIELIKSGLNPIVFTQTSIFHDSQGGNLNLDRAEAISSGLGAISKPVNGVFSRIDMPSNSENSSKVGTN